MPASKSKKKKRVGRGNASKGTYAGRGLKGQRSRSGGKSGLKRIGARDWLMKIPKKKGFKSPHQKPAWITVAKLDRKCGEKEVITPHLLKKKGLVDTIQHGVKILGTGPVQQAMSVKGFYISENAKKAIEKAGGKILNERRKKKKQKR